MDGLGDRIPYRPQHQINRNRVFLVFINHHKIGFVNLLNVGDYLQIGQIFLSENYSDDNIIPADFQPGKIAKIHKMDFMGKLIQFNNEKADGAILDLIQSEPEPTTKVGEDQPINTPLPAPATVKSI